jgi:hypothetical protein
MSKNNNPMDARSSRGVFSRGKPVYSGGSPNPAGTNMATAAKLLLKRGLKKKRNLV